MDTEKPEQATNGTEQSDKSIMDQMTDLVAGAAGTLAETAVKTVAKKATKYETVLNLKAAKALGLDVSAIVLTRADEVIE